MGEGASTLQDCHKKQGKTEKLSQIRRVGDGVRVGVEVARRMANCSPGQGPGSGATKERTVTLTRPEVVNSSVFMETRDVSQGHLEILYCLGNFPVNTRLFQNKKCIKINISGGTKAPVYRGNLECLGAYVSILRIYGLCVLRFN